ncbi:rod shape-determining protein [Candidatus Foliamicus sp.]
MNKFVRGFANRLAVGLAIDLGTANTLVYVSGRGIVLNEPSVVVLRRDAHSAAAGVLAIGKEAFGMLGRTPRDLKIIKPLKDGVIANYEVAEQMLKHFITKALGDNFFRPAVNRLVICVPHGATAVDRRAIEESAREAGAREVFVVDEPIVAAVGAGLPVHLPCGNMVVDIGGGTSEVAVLSMSSVVCARSVKSGGTRMDDAIVHYVRRNHGMSIGASQAEVIKREVASAYPGEEVREIKLHGRSLSRGLHSPFSLDSNEVRDALNDPLEEIVQAVLDVLANTPPELGADISQRGLVLAGGGALLPKLDYLIRERAAVPVFIAEDPLTCVVRGCGHLVEAPEAERTVADGKAPSWF